ncbi:MAG: haloacid dehalogenase-like hydrolase [Elusimicrobia bacterium]|nr:haloacid dehalogenase-like hydrolase [Elusimicrobiota bacterium]
MWWALAAYFSLASIQPKSAQAAPQAKSEATRPRRRPRYKDLKRPRRTGPPEILREAGWKPEVKKALETLVFEKGDSNRNYSAEWPPVAVIVLDDIAFAHHSGEVAFLRLVERAEFRFNDAWWKRIPADYRDRARRDYKRFSERSESTWQHDEDWLDWRKQLFSSYDLICRREGRRACRTWLTSVMTGYTEAECEAYMRETVDEALREPFRFEEIRAHAGDEKPIPAPRGVRRVPAMQELVKRLLESGFDVWALSSSNQWVAEIVAARYGIDPSRVVGVRTKVLNQRLQTDIIDPVPIGPGTAESVVVFIGRDPALVVSDSSDIEVLQHGKGLRVGIDRGEPQFNARATDKGWLLQPPLPIGSPEAE